jgi:putative lipoprotein (rSAM/lipoprotein system)
MLFSLKINTMKRNWKRKILGGLSLTSALFVFQACYGSLQDFGMDFLVEGKVKAKISGLPIKGIKVSVNENMQYSLTDDNGRFSFYTEILDSLTIKFEDIDSSQNGLYNNKDTLLTGVQDRVFLEIDMVEK